jgi:hypothetical protein
VIFKILQSALFVHVFIVRISRWSLLAWVLPSTGYLLHYLHSRHLPGIPCTTLQAGCDGKSNITHNIKLFCKFSQRFINLIDVIRQTVAFSSCRRCRLLQLMKATMLAESSFVFSPGSLCYNNVYRCESGRCHTLPFFIIFFFYY